MSDLHKCQYCGAIGQAWKGECPECPKGVMIEKHNKKDPQKWWDRIKRMESGTPCPSNIDHIVQTDIRFGSIEICPSAHRLDIPIHDQKWEFTKCFKRTEYIMVHKWCDQCGYVESTRHFPNGDEVYHADY